MASALITGTLSGTFEGDVVTGGKTSVITLTDDTFIAAGTGAIGSIANTQSIIDGVTSAQSETFGWNNEVRDKELVGSVVRTSDTVCTITWSASASYNITANEIITVTIPANVLVTEVNPLVATPTITINFNTASTVTSIGGNVQDGEGFDIYYAPGGLTGSTIVKLNNVSCTSVVVTDDFNMTVVAPSDDLLHGTVYTMEIS